LTRNFGLIIDYVQKFEIVLADGTVKICERPSESNTVSQDDFEIFRAVLGGNAGSFGIITRYWLTCEEDSKYPDSYLSPTVRVFEPTLYRNNLKLFQEWTQKIGTPQE